MSSPADSEDSRTASRASRVFSTNSALLFCEITRELKYSDEGEQERAATGVSSALPGTVRLLTPRRLLDMSRCTFMDRVFKIELYRTVSGWPTGKVDQAHQVVVT